MSGQPQGFPFPGQDSFTAFWQDFSARMMAAGLPMGAQNPSLDAMNQMRRMFFDSLAQHAEKFMRSEGFLQSMKQSMDAGLAWQQTLNQAMQKNLAAAQMPSRADVEHIALLVRGVEDRLSQKLDELSRRVNAVEGGAGENGAERQSSGPGRKKNA